MNKMKIAVISILILMLPSLYAIENNTMEKIRALNWQTASGTYKLNNVDATITTNNQEYFLKGTEAHEYMRLSEGHSAFKPNAVLVRVEGPEQDTTAIFTYNNIGYVEMDDWEGHINKDSLLKEIQNATEQQNKVRGQEYPSLYVDKWIQAPYLDKQNAIVYWAILAHTSNGDKIVNAKALKLGRKGYTEIIWMGEASKFKNAESSLTPLLQEYTYNEGNSYSDFIPGTDTVAAAGVGALAYKLITGKVAANTGLGLLAMLLLFAKKAWFLIFIPFIFIWKKLTGKSKDKDD